MRARKLLVLAGTAGLALSALASTRPPTASPVVATPLLDADGRAAPGNVIGKGNPRPAPKPDGGLGSR